jgi:tRNA (guanine26-N2/guanine27-N2)-dimethyltransferase
MAMDRDLAVAALAAAHPLRKDGRPARGWEMLAATGVRGLRLLQETPALGELLLTERHPLAFEVLRQNSERFRTIGARALRGDAIAADEPSGFDYVDVDPFGTPVPYLGRALDALAEGGLLAVTATDMPVLAGVHAAACRARYHAAPTRGRLGPEGGLRVLLGFVAELARARGRRLEPLLAYVLDHHVRFYAFLRSAKPSDPPLPVGVLDTDFPGPALPGPPPWGPFWLGALHAREFVRSLKVPARAERPQEVDRFLARLREEAEVDAPFFFEPNELAHALRLPEPPPLRPLLEGLRAAGYAAARAHPHPSAFRTTAPRAVVESLARAAIRDRTEA